MKKSEESLTDLNVFISAPKNPFGLLWKVFPVWLQRTEREENRLTHDLQPDATDVCCMRWCNCPSQLNWTDVVCSSRYNVSVITPHQDLSVTLTHNWEAEKRLFCSIGGFGGKQVVALWTLSGMFFVTTLVQHTCCCKYCMYDLQQTLLHERRLKAREELLRESSVQSLFDLADSVQLEAPTCSDLSALGPRPGPSCAGLSTSASQRSPDIPPLSIMYIDKLLFFFLQMQSMKLI